MTSGCTCVAVFVSGRKIYVANAGDSRAVMGISVGNTIVAHNLSRDHKPDVPEERARILAWGGFVSERFACFLLHLCALCFNAIPSGSLDAEVA